MNSITYTVTMQDVWEPANCTRLKPGPTVSCSGVYHPSAVTLQQLKRLGPRPKSHLIGSATELIAAEVLSGGTVSGSMSVTGLQSVSLRALLQTLGHGRLPDFGLRCDDLAVVGRAAGLPHLYVTECKGTTSRRGFRRDTEAKMIYQVSRTVEWLRRSNVFGDALALGGGVTVQVDHSRRTVWLMAGGPASLLADTFPDDWMYPDRKLAREMGCWRSPLYGSFC
jgi:hypothetical protein